jgi:hypothetical protein
MAASASKGRSDVEFTTFEGMVKGDVLTMYQHLTLPHFQMFW